MGAGASSSFLVPSEVQELLTKPLDASDVTDLEKARRELALWRSNATRMAKEANSVLQASHSANLARKALPPSNTPIPDNYQKPVVNKSQAIKDIITKAARDNLLFRACTDQDWEDCVNAFVSTTAASGDVLIQQGDEGDLFYVVESGTLDVWVKAPGTAHPVKVGAPLGAGSAFGELALMYHTRRAATIKASTDCTLWALDRHTYRAIKVTNQKARSEEVVGFLSHVRIGTRTMGEIFSHNDLTRVATAMEKQRFEQGKTIIEQGEVGDHFYILLQGEVSVYKMEQPDKENAPGKKVAQLKAGQYFGEKALLSKDMRAATVISDTPICVLTLGLEDFIQMFGNLEEFIHAKEVAKVHAAGSAATAAGHTRAWLRCAMNDFEIVAPLGRGAFGKVLFVKHKETNAHYALKCQPKKRIVEAGLQAHLVNEVKVMQLLDYPMIVSLRSAFQDNTYIYFCLEPCMGGELFTHLRSVGSFQEKWARFYGACVLLGLKHMHSVGVVYRDLKPENLVLNEKGHLKVVDFGLAKILGDNKSYTLCGTPDYLAPEMILNEGHTLNVDFWAFGVLLYEMVAGTPPFYAEDPMDTYERIISEDFHVPSSFSKPLGDLVSHLLKKNTSKRLGSAKGGASAISSHKWFNLTDWDGLLQGKVEPPIIPTLRGPGDFSYFQNPDVSEDHVAAYPQWSPNLDNP